MGRNGGGEGGTALKIYGAGIFRQQFHGIIASLGKFEEIKGMIGNVDGDIGLTVTEIDYDHYGFVILMPQIGELAVGI